MRAIEVICSDVDVHRQRLTNRTRNIDGYPEPSWQDVLARRDEWENWVDDHLVLDTVQPLEDNIERAVDHLSF